MLLYCREGCFTPPPPPPPPPPISPGPPQLPNPSKVLALNALCHLRLHFVQYGPRHVRTLPVTSGQTLINTPNNEWLVTTNSLEDNRQFWMESHILQ